MTVEPGFGGQEFIKKMGEKVPKLKKVIGDNNLDIKIEVDGGINLDTKVYVLDADIFVVGSYVTNSYDFQEAITSLRK
jgi:ribulose-phosphate 3-epimerase